MLAKWRTFSGLLWGAGYRVSLLLANQERILHELAQLRAMVSNSLPVTIAQKMPAEGEANAGSK